MNKNDKLTQFNTGGTHENNPNGGINIGNNNSVEENETKSGNFIYSNRIFLDSNIVSQYNLPKSLVGKSVADATKFIDNKFKGRNDKISQSTKNGMLSKIAEAQEAMKPAEPEMEQSQEGMVDPSQMALGGYVKQFKYGGSTSTPQYDQYGNVIPPTTTDALQTGLSDFSSTLKAQSNSEDSEDPDSETKNKVADYLQAGVTAIDLGKTAFGKPAQNTDGLAASAPVNSGGMIAGSAMKGASAGMAFGPLGAGIGAVVGAGAGLLGAGKAKKAAIKNSNNFAINTNRQFSDQYALGGKMDPPVKSNSILPLRPDEREQSMERYKLFRANAIRRPSISDYKPDLRTPEQAMMDYQYLRDSAKPGFNVDSGYRPNLTDPTTAQLLYNKRRNKQFVLGGNTEGTLNNDELTKQLTNQYFDKTSDYYKNLKLTPRNTAPIESLGLKSIGTTVPYTIGTQPTVDISNANKQFTPGPSFGKRVWEGTKAVGKYGYENAGNIARYAPIAANAYQLAKLKKPQAERLERLSNRYKPSYVDMAQQQNIVNQELNNVNSAIQASGASQGAIRNAMLGSQLNKTKALSNAYMNAEAQNRQQDDIAQQFNLSVDQTNLQQSNTEKDINARDQAAYRNEKSKYISAIGNDIGDVGKEQVQKKMISTATGYTYDGKYVRSADGNVVIDPETKEPMTGEKLKIQQSSKNVKKQALGGYLIKNKIK